MSMSMNIGKGVHASLVARSAIPLAELPKLMPRYVDAIDSSFTV